MRKAKIILPAIVVIVAIYFVLIYTGMMTGTVVDAESGNPIEGAVVLVEWTITTGKAIGLRATDSYKAVETVTDKDGKFTVLPVLNPFVDSPHVTIYKKGYVAWSNEFIFPDYKKREDFKWQNDFSIRADKFKSTYSHDAHITFISTVIRSTLAYENKKKMTAAFDWETDLAREEVKKKR